MQKTPHNHHTLISTGGRPTCNLRFADDIDLMGGSCGELQDLTNRLEDRATAHGMEVSTEKTQIVTNCTNNISADICMNGQKLEEVTDFKYLGATLCKDGTCSAKVHVRIARLNMIWQCNIISFTSKFKLYKLFVTAILLYDCETLTVPADCGKKKRIRLLKLSAVGIAPLLLGAQDQQLGVK